jgi:predicted GIY-YIG superfamily endonuclease
MTNRPNGVLYVGVITNLARRAWKVQLILGQQSGWADLYSLLL